MSVSKFVKDNQVYFEFHSHFCVGKSQVSNEILLQGSVGPDGLYSFPNLQLQSFPFNSSPASYFVSNSSYSNSVFPNCTNSVASVETKSSNLWHARLGHPNFHVMKLILQQCNIQLSNKNAVDFCASCCVGKSDRLPSSLSNIVCSAPLELIYSDLWGPSPVTSTNGFLYYITFVDAFSKYTWIYLLKNKSETFSIFQQFKAMVELKFNAKIKNLQTDWGGEFRPFAPFLAKLGINHRLICPHTHHQNGVVERKHRHIVESGLTLLKHASSTLKFWDYAFTTALFKQITIILP